MFLVFVFAVSFCCLIFYSHKEHIARIDFGEDSDEYKKFNSKKNFFTKIVFGSFILFILFEMPIGNDSKTQQVQTETQIETKSSKIHEETYEEKKKRIFEEDKSIIFANPFQEQPLSVRQLKADFSRYEGQYFVLGPLEISSNDLERKKIRTYAVIADDEKNKFNLDFDASLEIYYDKVQNTNKNLIDLQDNDIIFIKGHIEFTMSKYGLSGLNVISADEIFCVGTRIWLKNFWGNFCRKKFSCVEKVLRGDRNATGTGKKIYTFDKRQR